MDNQNETPEERETGQLIKQYLNQGERLLAFTSSEKSLFSARRPVVALTDQRLILVSAKSGLPADGVFSISRENIKDIKWSGAWARLNIWTKVPSEKIELIVYGRTWKRRAGELANLAKQVSPVSFDSPSSQDTGNIKTALSLEELASSEIQPQQYLQALRKLEKDGIITDATQRYLQRIRDLWQMGQANSAYRSLNEVINIDPAIRENPAAQKLLGELKIENLSLRIGGGFLLTSATVTFLLLIISGFLFGAKETINSYGLQASIMLYDVIMGINLWKGNTKFRVWALLRAGYTFITSVPGAVSSGDFIT